jgi:hypothetical protein
MAQLGPNGGGSAESRACRWVPNAEVDATNTDPRAASLKLATFTLVAKAPKRPPPAPPGATYSGFAPGLTPSSATRARLSRSGINATPETA